MANLVAAESCIGSGRHGSNTQNAVGRLAAVRYWGGWACDMVFTEMYSYNSGGAATKKRLRVNSQDFDSTYAYNNEGQMTSLQYPQQWSGSAWVTGPNRTLEYDAMARPKKLINTTTSQDIISDTTYNPMGQLLTMTGAGGAPSETRTYNSLGQMTHLTAGGQTIQYNFSATQNNGKIVSETQSGETVVYAYDSLNRLASATSSLNPGWGQSFAYDGFGNLTQVNVTKGKRTGVSRCARPRRWLRT